MMPIIGLFKQCIHTGSWRFYSILSSVQIKQPKKMANMFESTANYYIASMFADIGERWIFTHASLHWLTLVYTDYFSFSMLIMRVKKARVSKGKQGFWVLQIKGVIKTFVWGRLQCFRPCHRSILTKKIK